MDVEQTLEREFQSAQRMKVFAIGFLSLFMVLYYVGFTVYERNDKTLVSSDGQTVLGIADVKPSQMELKLNNSIAGQAVLELHTEGYTGEAYVDLLMIGQNDFQLLDTLCYPGLKCEIDQMGSAISVRISSLAIDSDGVVNLAYLFYDDTNYGTMVLDNSAQEESTVIMNGNGLNLLSGETVTFEFGAIR